MKLWTSGEIDAKIRDPFFRTRKSVERMVNDALAQSELTFSLSEWAVIAIIREAASRDYPEISRFHKRDNSLEFRLNIDFQKFSDATDSVRGILFLEMLGRSVEMMHKFKVPRNECVALLEVLARVETQIVAGT